jgi:hypothetical protein
MDIPHTSNTQSATTLNQNSEISLSRNIIEKARKLTEKLQKLVRHNGMDKHSVPMYRVYIF